MTQGLSACACQAGFILVAEGVDGCALGSHDACQVFSLLALLVLSLLALPVQKYKYWMGARSGRMTPARYSVYLLYWYCRCSVYLLYRYNSTNTDAEGAFSVRRLPGTQFTCFTGTKVQILTQKDACQYLHGDLARFDGVSKCVCATGTSFSCFTGR